MVEQESFDAPRICIVAGPSTKSVVPDLRAAIEATYSDATVDLYELNSENARSLRPAGDVVTFLFGQEEDADLKTWLEQWSTHAPLTPVLPIATGPNNVPPAPFERLKSRNWSVEEHRETILNRVGVLLGLKLSHGNTKLFVSYRAVDGRDVATQIHDHLAALGYQVFLDEAEDPVTNDPNLPMGIDVQERIEERLRSAHALLLVDSPKASESRWVHLEVEMALGEMIPILPVVIRAAQGMEACRFRQLQALHRDVPLRNGAVLSAQDLERVTETLEAYLADVYRRRTLGERRIARIFAENNWEFRECDAKPRLFEALAKDIRVLTCCSFEDTLFIGTLRQFAADVANLAAQNRQYSFRLYFYAGDPLFNENKERVFREEAPDLRDANIRLLHYEEAVWNVDRLSEARDALP